MNNFVKGILVFIVLIFLFGYSVRGEEGFQGEEGYSLAIPVDSEVGALIKSQKYTEAEKTAKAKNLDRRIIAMILAYAGKKDEAIQIFLDYLGGVPENIRERFALQTVHLASQVSPALGEDMFRNILQKKLLKDNSTFIVCHDMQVLIKIGDLNTAEQKLNEFLSDARCITPDLKASTFTLIAQLKVKGQTEKADAVINRLYQKFPNDSDMVLQRIANLVKSNPQQALAELEKYKKTFLSPAPHTKQFCEFLEAEALQGIGEYEKAKIIYQNLIDSHSVYENVAKELLKTVNRLTK